MLGRAADGDLIDDPVTDDILRGVVAKWRLVVARGHSGRQYAEAVCHLAVEVEQLRALHRPGDRAVGVTGIEQLEKLTNHLLPVSHHSIALNVLNSHATPKAEAVFGPRRFTAGIGDGRKGANGLCESTCIEHL